MKKASVLEFKLFEDRFCFNTDHIEYVFELEEFNEVKGFHDSVVGVTRYNKDIMLLIDTAKLYSDKKLNFDKELSVIVIKDEEGMYFGMIVDEIIKLEELESVSASVNLNSEEMVINHYKDKDADDIVNEIHPLPLLKKYAIPSMATLAVKNFKEEQQKVNDHSNYLLFKIAEHSYAIESCYIKEVLENDVEFFTLANSSHHIKGAIAVRDEVIPLIKLQETQESHDIVVLELFEKKMAIEVDAVYDIENFVDSKIEKLVDNESGIGGFYNYKGEVVAIVDPHFYFKDVEASLEKDLNKEEVQERNIKLDYLIFMMDGKKYSIDMKCVRQVLETDSLIKTQSSSIVSSENVEFIATWNKHGVNILNLKNLLGLQEENNDSQTIIIEYKGHFVAFMVQDIDNIVYLDRSEVSTIASQTNSLISGAIVYDSEVIAKLNEAFLANLG